MLETTLLGLVCIYTTINREASIRLDWRMNMINSKMIESGLSHETVTLEADTLDRTADHWNDQSRQDQQLVPLIDVLGESP